MVLALLVLIPFLIWGEGFERRFSQAGAIEWLRDYGRWAWVRGYPAPDLRSVPADPGDRSDGGARIHLRARRRRPDRDLRQLLLRGARLSALPPLRPAARGARARGAGPHRRRAPVRPGRGLAGRPVEMRPPELDPLRRWPCGGCRRSRARRGRSGSAPARPAAAPAPPRS